MSWNDYRTRTFQEKLRLHTLCDTMISQKIGGKPDYCLYDHLLGCMRDSRLEMLLDVCKIEEIENRSNLDGECSGTKFKIYLDLPEVFTRLPVELCELVILQTPSLQIISLVFMFQQCLLPTSTPHKILQKFSEISAEYLEDDTIKRAIQYCALYPLIAPVSLV